MEWDQDRDSDVPGIRIWNLVICEVNIAGRPSSDPERDRDRDGIQNHKVIGTGTGTGQSISRRDRDRDRDGPEKILDGISQARP